MIELTWDERFQEALCSASIAPRSRSIAHSNLFRLVQGFRDQPLSLRGKDIEGAILGSSLVQMVHEIASEYLDDKVLERIGYSTQHGAVALLARLLDPGRPDDVQAAIEAELDDLGGR